MIYPTDEDRIYLAEKFQLPFDSTMQDWEIEVANPQKLPEFIAYFSKNTLSEGQRVSLADIIFQSIEELLMEEQTDLAKEYFDSIFPLFQQQARILEGVIDYWKNNDFNISKMIMYFNN